MQNTFDSIKAHIVSHSHWDREWYMSFEKHRFHMIQLMDDLLELFENDPAYHSFHLDGQTVLIEDYLAVRPDRKALIDQYIGEKKIIVGPWYVLQDAFLTSQEANLRNLMYGIADANGYGQDEFIGYFPDTFGIYGQAPQILKQAGIDTAAFGRGVTPTGFNNMVFHDAYASQFSELYWCAPDGSRVLGILFANWYSNGNEIPAEASHLKAYWDQKIQDAARFSATGQLLFMNGCDHQPVQMDLSFGIQMANETFKDVTFVHTDLLSYTKAVREKLPQTLQTISGELRNQNTDGWSSLANTASSRVYLKIANDRCESKLETVLEPLVLMTSAIEKRRKKNADCLTFAWKSLMKNHPHDSICGCSVDEVPREMMARFEAVESFTDEMTKSLLTDYMLTHSKASQAEEGISFMVVNTSGEKLIKTHTETLEIDKTYFSDMHFSKIPGHLEALPKKAFKLIRASGEVVSANIAYGEVVFGFDLPKDGFRKPYFARRLKVTFLYESQTHLGHDCYHLLHGENRPEAHEAILKNKTLENVYLSVSVHNDGTFDLLDKTTGHLYQKLGRLIDEGDVGNSYMFKGTLEPSSLPIEVNVSEGVHSDLEGEIHIDEVLWVPEGADALLESEQKALVWHPERKSGRSNQCLALKIRKTLRLTQEARGLDIKVRISNSAKDHRLRMAFPLEKHCEWHYADSIFEIAKRPNSPNKAWQNPSVDHHMRRFVSLGESFGLTVATQGLHEYAILDQNTLAVTLLRSFGEMGDWGYFPTPEGQCQGDLECQLLVLPHKGNAIDSGIYQEAYAWVKKPLVVQTDARTTFKADEPIFHWQGQGLVLSAVKMGQDLCSKVFRWYNPTSQMLPLKMSVKSDEKIYLSNVLEKTLHEIGDGEASLEVKPHEIVTVVVKSN